jgi:hypothetical protein
LRALFIRPDGEFVVVGIGEMESAAAGENEDVFGNSAAGFDDFLFGFFEAGGIEDDEDAAAGGLAGSEAAVYGKILNFEF